MWDREFAQEIFKSLLVIEGDYSNCCFKGFYKGKIYFLKKILARPLENLQDVQERIERTEEINRQFYSQGIKTVMAVCHNGSCTHKTKEAIWVAYPWIDAEPIGLIDETLCYEVGRLLAEIHNLSITDQYFNEATKYKQPDFSWKKQITKMEDERVYPFVVALKEIEQYTKIEHVQPKEEGLILSHGDVHVGNLLKIGKSLILVDWELCGSIEPYAELFDTALNMSGFCDIHTNIRFFENVVKGYFVARKGVTKQSETASVIEGVFVLLVEHICNYLNDYLSDGNIESIKKAKRFLDQFCELKRYNKQFRLIIDQYIIENRK